MVSILKSASTPDPTSSQQSGLAQRAFDSKRPQQGVERFERAVFRVSYTFTGFLNSGAQGLMPGHFPQNRYEICSRNVRSSGNPVQYSRIESISRPPLDPNQRDHE
jgi:hypothetical protein